jgi:hypothetical protein
MPSYLPAPHTRRFAVLLAVVVAAWAVQGWAAGTGPTVAPTASANRLLMPDLRSSRGQDGGSATPTRMAAPAPGVTGTPPATATAAVGWSATPAPEPSTTPTPTASTTATTVPAATPTPVPPDRGLVLAYYYYWYDSTTGAHLTDSPVRYHPPASPSPTWRSVEWHKRQLSDMAYAGVDVALPVYWGFDRPDDAWSWQALPILAQAGQELRASGAATPRIGMFFDTTIVAWRDLTTPDGKAWFYANFKDFFSRIPRDQWALVDGRPLVFLFTSDWTAAVDQSTFDYVYAEFQSDFGVRPYLVREVSWDYPILRWEDGTRVRDYAHAIRTESSYLWGAAEHGYADRGGVASVGPGYDDSLLPGRYPGVVVDRQDGTYYGLSFLAAIGSGKRLLAIETWNELHEGSSVAETVEYGRQYLDLTRQLTAPFHAAQP